MYHLLVSYGGWPEGTSAIPVERIFENTDKDLVELYRPSGSLDIDRITRVPALFVTESGGTGEQLAHVGYINHISSGKRDIVLRYTFDAHIPPIGNEQIERLAAELGIGGFELTRTHWALKDVDLFRVLYSNHLVTYPNPKIFSVADVHRVEADLISVMMPFSGEFTGLYSALCDMAASLNMRAIRADDIWEHDVVIQGHCVTNLSF